jgi:hypothetical protein
VVCISLKEKESAPVFHRHAAGFGALEMPFIPAVTDEKMQMRRNSQKIPVYFLDFGSREFLRWGGETDEETTGRKRQKGPRKIDALKLKKVGHHYSFRAPKPPRCEHR